MIDIKLKNVNRVTKRLKHGEVREYYYHRLTNAKLHGEPGSPEFLKSYSEAEASIKSTNRNNGTFKALIQGYVSSPEYKNLAPRTRKDYMRQITKIEDKFGDMPIDVLNDKRVTKHFYRWRDDLSQTSKKQADYAITVLHLILTWSKRRGHVEVNRAQNIEKLYEPPKVPIVWSDEEIDAFLAHAGPEMHLAMMLAKDTGQRQGDLLKVTWSAIDGKLIRLTQSKTGVSVEIPMTDALHSLLSNQKRTATTILVRPDGRPWTDHAFRHEWRKVAKKAGIPSEKKFQKLRATTVTQLAEAECTVPQIASITGHNLKNVEAILEFYLARTRALSSAAITKLENMRRTKTANRSAN